MRGSGTAGGILVECSVRPGCTVPTSLIRTFPLPTVRHVVLFSLDLTSSLSLVRLLFLHP
jgi:hypothetical protein